MTQSELFALWQRHISADRINTALTKLAERRLARCVKRSTGGRPELRWYV
jgi:hypothetical protein